MNTMMNGTVLWRYLFLLCLPLYDFQASALKTSSLYFNITDSTRCLASDKFVRKLVNIPLHECVGECAAKLGRCEAVNYRKRSKLCELLTEDDGNMIENDSKTGPCVFVSMTSVYSNLDTKCECDVLESCDIKTHKCSIKECPRMTLVNGEVIGNMYEVGSTLEFHCNEKFVEINNRSSSTCLNTGNWSYEPECIVDCGPPPQPLHSIISLGLTTVTSVRTYSCITGFEPVPEEVTMVTTCGITGQWSPVSFTCVVDCGAPLQYNHSTISQGSTLVGSVRTYNCASGFAPIPEGAVMETICGDNGQWSPVSFTCVVDCGAPPELNHSTVSQGSTLELSVRTYDCNTGFAPEGVVMETICGINGQWSTVSFTCVVDCGPPPQPLHSIISLGLTTVTSVRTYSCITGFGPVPEEVSMVTTCGITGQWSPVSFTCVVDCGAPLQFNHSTISQGSTLVGSVRTYNCTTGFAPIPEGAVMDTMCGDSGQWSPVSFTCIVDCGPPPELHDSTVSQGSTLLGSVRTYQCNVGFAPEGAVMETICGINGQWSTVSFTCVVDCGVPPVVKNASVSPGPTIIGSIRSYYCLPGFVAQPGDSNMEIRCESTGNWSPASFACLSPTIGSYCYTEAGCIETGAECISSVCMCGPLFRYNTSIKDCVQACDVITDTFDFFEEEYIYGLNQLGYYTATSMDDCVTTCKNNPVCLSVDYFSDRSCFMSIVTYNMILDALSSTIKSTHGGTHASKRCE